MASRSNPTDLYPLDTAGMGPRTHVAGREVELDATASAAYSPLESLGRRVGLARSNSLQVRATLSDRVCLVWLSDRADLTGKLLTDKELPTRSPSSAVPTSSFTPLSTTNRSPNLLLPTRLQHLSKLSRVVFHLVLVFNRGRGRQCLLGRSGRFWELAPPLGRGRAERGRTHRAG